MKNETITAQILKNAQTLTQLHDNIDRAFKDRAKNPEAWQEACRVFHASYDSLAFPGGLENGLKLLKEKDPTAIVTAIEYLKADPYCFRSGYIKQKIVRLLKHVTLTPPQIEQLHDVLINVIKKSALREYIEYCRLASAIGNEKLRRRIEEIIKQPNTMHITQQAWQMLNALGHHKTAI